MRTIHTDEIFGRYVRKWIELRYGDEADLIDAIDTVTTSNNLACIVAYLVLISYKDKDLHDRFVYADLIDTLSWANWDHDTNFYRMKSRLEDYALDLMC